MRFVEGEKGRDGSALNADMSSWMLTEEEKQRIEDFNYLFIKSIDFFIE